MPAKNTKRKTNTWRRTCRSLKREWRRKRCMWGSVVCAGYVGCGALAESAAQPMKGRQVVRRTSRPHATARPQPNVVCPVVLGWLEGNCVLAGHVEEQERKDTKKPCRSKNCSFLGRRREEVEIEAEATADPYPAAPLQLGRVVWPACTTPPLRHKTTRNYTHHATPPTRQTPLSCANLTHPFNSSSLFLQSDQTPTQRHNPTPCESLQHLWRPVRRPSPWPLCLLHLPSSKEQRFGTFVFCVGGVISPSRNHFHTS